MTKEITKAIILQEIQDKFRLREFDPANFLFSETVVPTYNVEPHLGRWETLTKTVSITSADSFTFFEVPVSERWMLRAYEVVYGMTGAIKGSGLYMSWRPSGSNFMYLDLKAGQEVTYLVNLPTIVTLESGNTLRYLIDTYVSTQDLTILVDVWKEEIR